MERHLVACLLGAALTSACASVDRDLERVARDWSKVVRASQVIPAYPLTEDLRPGDVFVVDRPPIEQARDYDRRGFLPLDQLLTRLPVAGALRAEDGRGGSRRRRPRRCPDAGPPAPARRAAFPSFAFEVRRGSGLGLAIPATGVPIGLAIMQASAARGSLQIADARTHGLGIDVLRLHLDAWASQPTHRRLLRELASRSTGERPVRLRVVQRVYTTRSIVVTMQSTAALTAGAEAGDAPDTAMLGRGSSYPDTIADLDVAIRHALPGGRIRIAQASRRAVTLHETFDRPLALGYLAFDVAVLPGGLLGAPSATLDALESGQAAPAGDPAGVLGAAEAAVHEHYAALRGLAARSPRRAARVLQSLVAALGDRLDDPLGDIDPHADADAAVARFVLAATRWTSTDDPAERAFRLQSLADALDLALAEAP